MRVILEEDLGRDLLAMFAEWFHLDSYNIFDFLGDVKEGMICCTL